MYHAVRTVPVVPWAILGEPPWAAPAPPEFGDLPASGSLDVLIVGAGITGLSCAMTLAADGREVVVVDRHFGAGAASRSGGIIVGDTLVGPAPEFEDCDVALRDWARTHAPASQVEWHGCLELDRDPHLPVTPIDWQDAGTVRLSRTIAGGTIDPAALVAALARSAVTRGARIVDGITVEGCEAVAGGVAVATSSRMLRARTVVFAVDATSRSSEPEIDLWPVRQLTVAVETYPVLEVVTDAMGWRDRLPFYTNELPLLWGRGLDDGGLLIGRELVPVDHPDSASLSRAIVLAVSRLLDRIHGLHPVLATIGLRRAWAGPIARDDRGVPSVQRDRHVPGVWWAGGYGGHGLAQAFRLGEIAARRISGP